MAGFIADPAEATAKLPAVPRLALVQPACEARTLSGQALTKSTMDLYSHMLSMQRVHQSYAGTGVVGLAVAASMPGTIVHGVLKEGKVTGDGKIKSSRIRLGHPSGILEVEVQVDPNGTLDRVSMGRTARRLMDGRVYVPVSLLG